ncbi:Transcription factor bHLH82 [Hibiscus syriacus]|uniref:Transcription factor bHLH82 n=1 Tax=Hibiscus syriacus TaxID=106335 RepID=A0A6A3A7P5_HIBSY|nr:Transcription factor bHLH82 [Hibiscus syriacus]
MQSRRHTGDIRVTYAQAIYSPCRRAIPMQTSHTSHILTMQTSQPTERSHANEPANREVAMQSGRPWSPCSPGDLVGRHVVPATLSISKTFKATATVITTHQQKQNPELDPTSSQDDFLEQMLSILPSCSWPSDLKSPWDPPKSDETGASNPDDNVGFQYDEILASELRQHQLNGGGGGGGGSSPATEAMKMMMQQQIMLPGRGVAAAGGGGLAMPLSLDVSGAAVSRHQTPNLGATARDSNGPKSGKLFDDRSYAGSAQTKNKASVLDEIIDYVKFLQLKVKVLIMSRMGGAGAVAPHVANMPSETTANGGGSLQRNFNGNQTSANDDSITVTEHQVAELIEEDMGSAMRGPVANPRKGGGNYRLPQSNGEGPSSPSMSVLTVQSATRGNGGGVDGSVKDATSVFEP